LSHRHLLCLSNPAHLHAPDRSGAAPQRVLLGPDARASSLAPADRSAPLVARELTSEPCRPRYTKATVAERSAGPRQIVDWSGLNILPCSRSGPSTRPGRMVALRLKRPLRRGYWSARRAAVWMRLPPGSDRPGALRRRALLRTGLATLAASGSSNVRRVWQSKGLRSVQRAGGSSAGPLTPAIGRGV
jgi:hypothetical protein